MAGIKVDSKGRGSTGCSLASNEALFVIVHDLDATLSLIAPCNRRRCAESGRFVEEPALLFLLLDRLSTKFFGDWRHFDNNPQNSRNATPHRRGKAIQSRN
jgi:hypothetical protein